MLPLGILKASTKNARTKKKSITAMTNVFIHSTRTRWIEPVRFTWWRA
jgi:hypothetical protein